METTPAKKRSWNLFVLTFIAGAVLSPFAGSCRGQSQLILADTENPLEKSAAVKGSLVLQQALREIYKEVNPAVVRIETEQKVSLNRTHFIMILFSVISLEVLGVVEDNVEVGLVQVCDQPGWVRGDESPCCQERR